MSTVKKQEQYLMILSLIIAGLLVLALIRKWLL